MSEEVCRFCGQSDSIFLNLLENPSVMEKIKICLKKEVSPLDKLPVQCCSTCCDSIENFAEFIAMTKTTEDHLLKIAKTRNHPSNELQSVVQKLRTRSDLSMVKIVSVAVAELPEVPEDVPETNAEDCPSPPSPKKLKMTPIKINGLNYLCVNCRMKFNTSQELSKHIETQGMCKYGKRNLKTKCPTCYQLFSTSESLIAVNKHIVKCAKDAQGNNNLSGIPPKEARYNYLCSKCPMKFNTFDELTKHADTPGLCTSLRIYKCPKCKKNFNNRGDLQQHMITPGRCKVGEKHNIKCHICSIKMTSLRGLYTHIIENHPNSTVVQYLNCDDCDLKFTDHFSFENHKITIHGKVIEECDSSKNICRICMKKFPSREELFRHIEEYDRKKKKNLCDKCGKSFETPYALKCHINRTHQEHFKCTRCNLIFTNQTDLNQHNKSSEPPISSAAKVANKVSAITSCLADSESEEE